MFKNDQERKRHISTLKDGKKEICNQTNLQIFWYPQFRVLTRTLIKDDIANRLLNELRRNYFTATNQL